MSGVQFQNGDKVRFRAGRAGTEFVATVTGREGAFLVTADDHGKVRKVRAGAARAA